MNFFYFSGAGTLEAGALEEETLKEETLKEEILEEETLEEGARSGNDYPRFTGTSHPAYCDSCYTLFILQAPGELLLMFFR